MPVMKTGIYLFKIDKRPNQVGKEGFEPSRLSARDPKSRLSANSSTSP